LERTAGPTALLLSRQGLPVLEPAPSWDEGLARGAYVQRAVDDPHVILVATGGEVSLALDVATVLDERGVAARVVSMPSWELFRAQPEDYRRSVLPPEIPRLAIEAGVTMGWHEWVGDSGAVVGIDRYGASAPGAEVAAKLGLNIDAVVARAMELVAG
jgi:transketolase